MVAGYHPHAAAPQEAALREGAPSLAAEPLVTTWGNVTLPRARDVGEVTSGTSWPSAASAAGSASVAAGYHPHAAAPREGAPSLAPVEPLVTTWGNVTLPRATTGTLPLATSPSLADELRGLREALL